MKDGRWLWEGSSYLRIRSKVEEKLQQGEADDERGFAQSVEFPCEDTHYS